MATVQEEMVQEEMGVPIVIILVKEPVIAHVHQPVKVPHLEVPLGAVVAAVRVRVAVVLHVLILVQTIAIMDAEQLVRTIAPIIVLVDAIELVLVLVIQLVQEHVTERVMILVGDHVI